MTMPWQDFITELLVKRHGAVHLVAGHDYHFGYKNQGDPRLFAGEVPGTGDRLRHHPQGGAGGRYRQLYLHPHAGGGRGRGAGGAVPGPPPLPDPDRGPRPPAGPHAGHPHGEPHLSAPCAGAPPGRIHHTGLSAGRHVAGGGHQRGTRPTVSDGTAVSVETFLLDFDGDLYGKCIGWSSAAACGTSRNLIRWRR